MKKQRYPGRKKKAGSKTKRYYFTEVHEKAILQYTTADCNEEKTKLYKEIIGPVFNELIEKIVYTYKFSLLPNVDILKEICRGDLMAVLDKFDPTRGYKAYSYFTRVTINWFSHKQKDNAKKLKREISYTDFIKEGDHEKLVTDKNIYYEERDQKEFLESLLWEIDKWEEESIRENDKKVIEAIRILLKSRDDIEIFNKKAVYLYLREITKLNTKQIVTSLKRIKVRYGAFREKWNTTGE